MKILKQITLVFAALVLFANCSKDEAAGPAVVGKWKAGTATGKINLLGQTTDINENLAASNLVYDLKADGTFTSTGSFDVVNTQATATPISGTYKTSGSTITFSYTNAKKVNVTENYTYAVSGSSMTLKLTLDEYKRQITASGDPNAGFVLALISSLDLTINFTKQ
jgi:hypothetical protein